MLLSQSTPLKDVLKLAPACSCKDCTHGCTIGSGFLAEGDAEKMAKFLGISVEALKKDYLEEKTLFNRQVFQPKLLREGKPYGKCVFLKEGKCSVHPVKPLQCKIAMGCKDYGEDLQVWFMLNHFVDWKDKASVSEFEVYKKSGGKLLPE